MGRETPSPLSRRELLGSALGFGALAAMGLHTPEALAAEERVERNVQSLSRPRIDWELTNDVEKVLALEEQVGFLVREVSVPLRNVVSTECVRLVYGEGGEFAWLWTIQPGGRVPFKHHHQSEERLTLKTGTLHCWMQKNGKQRTEIARAGEDDFVIPPGTDHQPFVPADGEPVAGIVHFELEESAARVTTLYWNMVNDGLMNKKGQPDFLKMLAGTVGEEERTYLANIPSKLQDVAREIVEFFQQGRIIKKDAGLEDIFEK